MWRLVIHELQMDYAQAADSLRPRLRWCEKSKQPSSVHQPLVRPPPRTPKKMEKREAKKQKREREDE